MSSFSPHPDDTSLDRLLAFLRRVVMRSGGGAMALLAIWLTVAISDFSISDPSWNNATGASVSNITGPVGAVSADIFLQLLGGGILFLVPPMLIWGVAGLIAGPPEETSKMTVIRMALVPVCLVLGVGFLASLPVPVSWPFASTLGGSLGTGLRDGLVGVFGFIPEPWPNLIIGCAFAFAFLYSYPILCGLTRAHLEAVLDLLEEWGAILGGLFSGLADRAGDRLGDGVLNANGAWWHRKEDSDGLDGDLEDYFEGEELLSGAQERGTNEDLSEDLSDGLGDVSADRKRKIIRSEKKKRNSRREAREAQHHLPVFEPGSYELPPLNLLSKTPPDAKAVIPDSALEKNARMLESVLSDFGVRGEIINVRPGPVVTLYELEPAAGVKSSRVIGLADDIARSMSAVAARVAVVPGRNVIGIELPNQDRETVYLRSQLATTDYESSRGDLTLSLGVDIGGEPVYTDLARMPHLLIAGTTGSGKSVGINTMILSLLYRLSPDQCKLILIDPKMLELSVYDGIPHLLSPVVTDPRKAVVALKWTVREMEERYQKMSKIGVRNVAGFNERVLQAEENGEVLSRTVHTGYDAENGEPIYEKEEFDFKPMPFIVVVIDEVADLMMVAGKDIEGMVQRLAQMARAAGIHLIMATQRPSVDVITGTIKANFPTRISFQVTSKIDSRTILGEQGAEQLLGMGDMLYMAGGGRLRRVHGPFVADNEVEKIVKFLKKQGKPDYVQEVTEMDESDGGAMGGLEIGGNTSSGDALYDKAVAIVLRDRKASTSYVQRRLQIGYNRAATLIEKMEDEGVISPPNNAGKREILVGESAA